MLMSVSHSLKFRWFIWGVSANFGIVNHWGTTIRIMTCRAALQQFRDFIKLSCSVGPRFRKLFLSWHQSWALPFKFFHFTHGLRQHCDWVQSCARACAYLRTDGLVQDCSVSSALAMETLRSRTGPSMYARSFVPTLSNNFRPPSRTSAWTVICIKPPRPSTVRSRYCTDRFDIKLQADSILTHRSCFGEPWVSAPSTPGNLSVL